MKKALIINLFLCCLYSASCSGQLFSKGLDDSLVFSNFQAGLKIEKIYLEHYHAGYIILEGDIISLDPSLGNGFSIGEKVHVIVEKWRFDDTIDVNEVINLNVCDFNLPHYFTAPRGGRVEIFSHNGKNRKCFLTQYNEGDKRTGLSICPTQSIPLLLCAEVLGL